MYAVMFDVFSPRAIWALPFALASALPYVLLLLPGPAFDPEQTAGCGALTLIVLAFAAAVPWKRRPDWWTLVPALGYLAVVALLREAGGGNASGVGPMVLLPVIWIALFGSPRTLAVTVGAVALVYWAPLLINGVGERYPDSGWRIGALFTALCAILGVTMQGLRDQIRRQAARLTSLALADDLTGLANRRAWDVAVEAALIAAERRAEPVCVALLDVDHFKAVNDARGHAAGDAVLVALARAWAPAIRRGDVLARLGGDEFGLLLPAGELDDARELVDRLAVTTHHTPCSIGLARWDGEESAAQLLARADALLYEAKALGRNRLRMQDTGVRGRVIAAPRARVTEVWTSSTPPSTAR
jgi:diguanylate cyclase (GGDEF)-like protein